MIWRRLPGQEKFFRSAIGGNSVNEARVGENFSKKWKTEKSKGFVEKSLKRAEVMMRKDAIASYDSRVIGLSTRNSLLVGLYKRGYYQ